MCTHIPESELWPGAASKSVWPEGWGRWFCSSPVLMGDCFWLKGTIKETAVAFWLFLLGPYENLKCIVMSSLRPEIQCHCCVTTESNHSILGYYQWNKDLIGKATDLSVGLFTNRVRLWHDTDPCKKYYMLTMQFIKAQWYYHHYPLEKEKGSRTQASFKKLWPYGRCRSAETEIWHRNKPVADFSSWTFSTESQYQRLANFYRICSTKG